MPFYLQNTGQSTAKVVASAVVQPTTIQLYHSTNDERPVPPISVAAKTPRICRSSPPSSFGSSVKKETITFNKKLGNEIKCKWMFQKLALWRNLFNRLVPQDLWQEKKPRNSIKVIQARSGTNLIFQLMGVPSRKEAANRGLWILRHAGPRRRNTEQVFCIQLLVKK